MRVHARTRCVFAWTSESACLRASSSPSRYFCVFVSARDRCLTPPPRPAQLSKLVRHLPQPRQPVVRQSQRVERLRTRARTGEREGVRERASLPCLRYRLQRTPPLLASLSFPPPPTPLSANQLGCNPTPPDGLCASRQRVVRRVLGAADGQFGAARIRSGGRTGCTPGRRSSLRTIRGGCLPWNPPASSSLSRARSLCPQVSYIRNTHRHHHNNHNNNNNQKKKNTGKPCRRGSRLIRFPERLQISSLRKGRNGRVRLSE